MHTYTGVPASSGIVVGPVEQIDHGTTGLHRIVCDPFRERALYDGAVVLAKDELRRLSQRAKGPDADILLFQIALLEDESSPTRSAIISPPVRAVPPPLSGQSRSLQTG